MSIHIKEKSESYSSAKDLAALIHYVETDKPTGRKCYYRGYINTSPYNAVNEFLYVKHYYGKLNGRYARHLIISFDKQEQLTNDEIYELGFEFAKYYSDSRQIVFAVHTNTDHQHIHMVVNTVSFTDGRKLHESYENYFALKSYIERKLQEYKQQRGY